MALLLVSLLSLIAVGCSGVDSDAQQPVVPDAEADVDDVNDVGHLGEIYSVVIDVESLDIQVIPSRAAAGHIWGKFSWLGDIPEFIEIELADHDKWAKEVTLDVCLTNPLPEPVYDPRMIFYADSGVRPLDFDAYTDYHPVEGSSMNPFCAFAKDFERRMVPPGESDSRQLVLEYDSLASLVDFQICLDASIGGNTSEPYAFGDIIQRGRGLYVDVFDWQGDASLLCLTRVDGNPWALRLNRINDEDTWSASMFFPENPADRFLLAASSEGSTHAIYTYIDWDPGLMPENFGRGIYAWSFYNPDTGKIPPSFESIVNQCKNKFGCSWVMANMGQVCYDGTVLFDEEFFLFLHVVKEIAPDFPVFLNIGLLGFGPGDYDHCGNAFHGDFRAFFGGLEKGLLALNKKFDLRSYVDGFCFDFEAPLSVYPMWQRREFLDAYGDFIARLRIYTEFEGLYLALYQDALMAEMVDYDSDANNHCKQADFFLCSAYASSYAWNQDWWLGLEKVDQLADVPSAMDYLEGMLDTYSDIANAVATPFHPVVDMQGVWMDYHGDTLPHVQRCELVWLADISEWCFGYQDSFASSDEMLITKGRWLHKKEIERVIVDLRLTDVDVLSKTGGVFYVLGDRYPDIWGDDIIFARTPFGYQAVANTIHGYDEPYRLDPCIFRWEVAQKYKMWGLLQSSPNGLGAVSGRISFWDGSTFLDHFDEYRQSQVVVTGLPDDLPGTFYSTDIIGLDDGSYVFAGLPAGMTVTLQASAGTYVSDPLQVEIKKGVHERGIDLVLHPE